MQTASDNLRQAVIVIVFTVLTLSLGDAIIKTLSAKLVLWQIFVLRSLVAMPLLLLVLRIKFPGVPLMPASLGWTATRSLMLALMWVAYYAALPHMPLSVAAAAYYTLPLFITLFSAMFIGEPIRLAGWLAVALGFAGMLLIVKPTTDGVNFYILLPLVAAMLFAIAMILTRTKCRNEHPLILSGALNVTFILVGLLFTIYGSLFGDPLPDSAFTSTEWATIGPEETMAIGILGIAILVASIGTAVAYQNGPASVIATFDFAYVGFAVIWGFVFFREVPDLVSIGGMLLIVIGGIIAVQR